MGCQPGGYSPLGISSPQVEQVLHPQHTTASPALCRACLVMLHYTKHVSPASTVKGRESKILPLKFFLLIPCKRDAVHQ